MTDSSRAYWVLAYYSFCPIEDPYAEVAAHKAFFKNRDVACRIYISEQGLNGQMSASCKDAQAYIDWMHSRPLFKDLPFKIHYHPEHVFPRKTVKYRKQLVALDRDVDLNCRGEYVSPRQWKEMLQEKEKKILLDVRNDYEWKIGHFEGSTLPPCETFREFAQYAEDLKQAHDPKETPVMMCCTGGIRCELYSSILKEKGFDKVYQLEGGIINYGLQEGNAFWKGKLFVFDDRLAVSLTERPEEPIAACHHCEAKSDAYYNCANMDCNELFLCCPACLETFLGCCGEACKTAPRLRPFHKDTAHKPFRKKRVYAEAIAQPNNS